MGASGKSNWQDVAQVFKISPAGQWMSIIEKMTAGQSDLLNFASGAKTMSLLYYGQSKKGADKDQLQSALGIAGAAMVAYLKIKRTALSLSILAWIKEVAPEHALVKPLSEYLTTGVSHGRSGPSPEEKALRVDIFKELPEPEASAMIATLKAKNFKTGDRIFEEQDAPTEMYIIASGKVEIRSDKLEKPLVLGEQEFFGEIALMLGRAQRGSSAVALEETEVVAIPKEQLIQVFAQFPQVEQKILRFFYLRLFLNVAKTHPAFSGLKNSDLDDFLYSCNAATLKSNQILFREGAKAESLFLLIDGEIAISSKEKEIAKLGDGSFLGEMGLLSRSPRSATAKALRQSQVLECPAFAFDSIAKEHPQIRSFLAELAASRELMQLIH